MLPQTCTYLIKDCPVTPQQPVREASTLFRAPERLSANGCGDAAQPVAVIALAGPNGPNSGSGILADSAARLARSLAQQPQLRPEVAVIPDLRADPRCVRNTVFCAFCVTRWPLLQRLQILGAQKRTIRSSHSSCSAVLWPGWGPQFRKATLSTWPGQCRMLSSSNNVHCRTKDSPYMNGQLAALRFYASAPLLSSDGQRLGTL